MQHFFELAEKEDYFKNTIFVITGDHGRPEKPIYDLCLQSTHIPCLIYNPGFIGIRQELNIAGQIDLTQVLLGMLKIDYRTTNLGRDLLHMPSNYSGFALMEQGSKLGFLWNEWYLIDRIGGSASLHKYDSTDPIHDYALERPEILHELQHKARSLFFVTNDIILNRKAAPDNWVGESVKLRDGYQP